jgi:hypothetical protein
MPLEAGYDGVSLRKLAGLIAPTSRDVGDLFQNALQEIGTKITSKEQGILFLSKITAADILEGRVDPAQGAAILAHYSRMLNYRYLADFDQMSEMLDLGEYAPPKTQIIRDILAHARMLLSDNL